MKILVSDFDGTLYDNNFQNNIKAVNKFVDNGNIFIIATGRNINSLLNEIDKTNLKYNYLICNDGGTIYDNNKNLLIKKCIPRETVKKLCQTINNYPMYVEEALIDSGGEYSTNEENECITLVSKIIDRHQAEIILSNILENNPDVSGYLSKNWINIVSKEVSKGNAINYLATKENFNQNNIYTIGDDVNDITMIKRYHGYAIKNGTPLLNFSNKYTTSIEELINNISESNNN